MRKIITSMMLISVLFLAACSFSFDSADDGNEKTNEENSTEQQNNDEKTDIQASKNDNANEANEGENTDETNTNEKNNNDTAAPLTTEQILQKSAEAMNNLSNMKVVADIETTEQEGYMERGANRHYEIEISLEDPVTMHQMINVEFKTNLPMNLEAYLTPEFFYARDTSVETWQYTSRDMATNQYFTIINTDILNRFKDHSSEFELTDQGNHYKLSFAGENDMFKAVVYGDAESIENTLFRGSFDVMEISGEYELLIDKATFHVTGYAVNYTASVNETKAEESATYQLSNFNEVGEVVVPTEVTENADPSI